MIRDNVHRRGSPYLRNGAGVRAWDTPAVPSPPARAEELAECDLGDQRIKVLVLIPTLRFGGAENDLARNLPRIDHSRFKITVCAFLERGSLAQALLDAGVRVIGPLLPTPCDHVAGAAGSRCCPQCCSW